MTNNDKIYVKFLEILSEDCHPTLKFIKVQNLILNSYLTMLEKTDWAKNELMNEYISYLTRETK